MELAVISVTPFALAALMPTAGRLFRKTALAWGLAAALGMVFAILLTYLPAVTERGALLSNLAWVPELGLTLSLHLDGLALFFALIITGIGALVILYAGYYFEDVGQLARFAGYALTFMGAMLGLVLAGNLLVLFIFWELTSITSYFLISFKSYDAEARAGALQALMVTGGGGLALLAGVMLLGTAAGTFELPALLAGGEVLHAHAWYPAIVLLIGVGCFAKSAQWPLHFWLPDAMSAPTPASAYLHSATMVKAGIYLLLRLAPALGDTALWQGLLISVGLITMLVGAVIALRKSDLKAILAYSTISQLGALVALIGLPYHEGLKAAMVGILAHALYKCALFLIAGVIDHAMSTRDLTKLAGLAKHLPTLAGIAVVAGLSMAGLPPLFGFIAKETLLESVLHGPLAPLTAGIVTVSAALTVTVALILVWDVFFANQRKTEDFDIDGHTPHHLPSPAMLIAPGVLAAGSLLFGLLPGVFAVPLIAPYAAGKIEKVALYLFAGFNTPLLLSIVAVGGGIAIFSVRRWWGAWAWPALPKGSDGYQLVVSGIEKVADLVLKSQSGNLRHYLGAIIVSVIVLMSTAGLTNVSGQPLRISIDGSADLLKIVLLVLALGATLASVLFKRHLIAALALGVGGYSVGGLFLLEPAPDVALVQFLVETLGTVLIVIMLGKISAPERQAAIKNLWGQSRRGLARDIMIATLVGGGVALFTLQAVVNRPTRTTVTQWHIDNTQAGVGISDIVGAIVTDFRGMDTVIEITVFGIAALGVLTLLSTPEPGKTYQINIAKMLRQLRAEGRIDADKQYTADKDALDPKIQQEMAALEAERAQMNASRLNTPLTGKVASLVLPFSLLIACAHILYGGDAPGDGFTAGVVAGIGVALWYVVFGYDEAKRRLRWLHPARLVGAGIGLAVLNAALPMLFGRAFLANTQLKVDFPAGLHFSSTSIFEFGIFLCVLGGISVILETIAHPQEVEGL